MPAKKTAQPGFGDKEILTDVLASEKLMTNSYNTFTNECATPAVLSEFMSLLTDEHQIQNEIFTEMQSRGWYKTEAADQNKINQTKQQFASM